MIPRWKNIKIANKIRKNKRLDKQQLQLCYGTLLGDSSINVRANGKCRLKMCHTEKQREYIEFKKRILEPFILQQTPTKDISGKTNPKNFSTATSYHYNTIVHQDFTNLYGLFYTKINKGKRKQINMNILNLVEPFAILIWYLDDGCYYHDTRKSSHKLYLSTYRYSLPEHKTLKKWFWHKWRIISKISFDKTHNMYYLRFNKQEIIKFTKLFLEPSKCLIPKCMYYKFPEI